MNYIQRTTSALLITLLAACGGSSGDKGEPQVTPPKDQTPAPEPVPEESTAIKIKVNQLGYLPNENKIAIVPSISSTAFELIELPSQEVVFEGILSEPFTWQLSGDEQFKQADFSSFTTPGTYTLSVAGVDESSTFAIHSDVYSPLHDAALKFYYFNRASTAIEAPYASNWARAAGHSDEQVKIHASAATAQRPAASIIASSKGWYDAGDFGKYMVNSGITTYNLLAAYEHFPAFYQNRDINIPESDDNIPDILNEILWNIEWLATMQDQDGSVYHKLTTLDWPGQEMPNEDNRDRYVIGKSTAAALNYAAVLAMASRIYQPFDSAFPGKSEQWLTAAEDAWAWAVANENQPYQQPSDVSSGEYGDNSFNDEFSWAAAELFITTKKMSYLEAYNEKASKQAVPSWGYVSYLAASTLLLQGENDIDPIYYQRIKTEQLALADNMVEQYQSNNYAVAMVASDFVWGSNSVVLGKAMVLLQAYRLSGKANYKKVALEQLHYVLGRNPTDYSFVTGFGTKTPMHPHHRVSESDGIEQPIPGMLVGGPHGNTSADGCAYPYTDPARAYLDDWCSFSTNEIAINWNAPLVYVLAAILSE